MASWHEFALAGLAIWASGCSVSAGQSLPLGAAENAAASGARGGFVAPEAGGTASLQAIEIAVRADAARMWQLGDLKAPQFNVEEVSWADGALGCPRPGMAYTQALVPGWRLIVRHSGREAVYHASRRGQWLLCPAGQVGAPRPGESTR